MLCGFDTEYSFDSVREIRGKLHGDVTTLRPVCAVLYFEDGRELRLTDRWERLQGIFDNSEYTFVVHGAHAEYGFCKRVGLRFPTDHYYDTLLMGVMFEHASSFEPLKGAYTQAKLANLTTRWGLTLLTDEKDEIRTSIMLGKHGEEFGMQRVLDYCRDDARATVQLFHPLHAAFAAVCGPNAMKNLINLYQPYSLIMAEAQRKGIRFDQGAWDRLLNVAPEYRERLLNVMRAAGYDHDGDGLGDRAFRKMITSLGLARNWPRAPKGQFRTREDDLKSHRHMHVAIDATHKLLKFDAFMNQDIGARVDRDRNLRCGILPLAQRTSRNSTTSPNLMGIPGELRPVLVPDENCVFLHFDYSQQEPGIAGYLSGDKALLHDFATGDVYRNLGFRMGLLRPEMSTEQIRSIRNSVLKSLMLAIIYGKTATSIASDLPCSIGEATMHLKQFDRTYPRLFGWLKNYQAVSLQQGWAENIIGYRACYKILDAKTRAHITRSCQNFPIQASAAACFQITGLHLADFGGDIRLPLHDAYLLNVPNNPRAIAEAEEWVSAATTAATGQLFPGLPVKRDIDVLTRFAKDGKEDSFENWITSLESQACGSR